MVRFEAPGLMVICSVRSTVRHASLNWNCVWNVPAVVGVPDAKWGEIGVAFLVAADPAPSPEDLTAFLQERLARFKLPRAYEFVAELPRTPYGKVIKGPAPAPLPWRKVSVDGAACVVDEDTSVPPGTRA